ncbi:MAG: hypothetical protein ABH826_00200 [Patescibacteria group bacterium]|nr:hypothetical protein [Patescibacteria group bacterium]
MNEGAGTIEKPASQKQVKADNLIIRVMPKEFFGRDVSVSAPTKLPQVSPLVTQPLPLPKPLPQAKQTLPKKKKRGVWFIVIIGALLLAVLSILGYFWLQSVQTEPIEEPTIIIPEPEPEPVPKPILPSRGQDTDSDGLTDVEEELYGTDYRNPDSDGDSFLDGNEVFHRYDPLGFAPSTLLDTGAVKEFFSDKDGVQYSITYPAEWSTFPEINFTWFSSKTTNFPPRFSVEIHEKDLASQTLKDWYEAIEAVGNGAADLKNITTKNGYSGLESNDQRKVYLNVDASVIEFTYELDETKVINYSQTFQMFVNSFSVQP